MKPLYRNLFIASALGLFLFEAQAVSAEETSTKFSRHELLKKPVSLPSKDIEAKVIHVQFPKGYKTPLHTHEGEGPRYVLKGKLKVEDSGQSNVYGPGEVFWETGSEMTVENVGKTEAEIIIFELAVAKSRKE